MLILDDESTLLHETVELLGSKLIPALESPARIKAIVSALKELPKHDLRNITASEEDHTTTLELAKATHQADYLEHIQSVFKQWRAAGLVEPDDSVLPECFRLQNKAHSDLKPPKDIYARAGYYAFDMSSGITQHSWTSIIASANLAVQAAQLILPNTTSTTSPPTSSSTSPSHPPNPSSPSAAPPATTAPPPNPAATATSTTSP